MKDIIHIHVIGSDATMEPRQVTKLYNELCGSCPDECFLGDLSDQIEEDDDGSERVCADEDCDTVNDHDAKFCKACGRKLPIKENSAVGIARLDWNGDDSGRTFHSVFLRKIVPHIKGRIEAVALLEGDDEVSPKMLGILIEDGVYTKCDVDVRLSASHT